MPYATHARDAYPNEYWLVFARHAERRIANVANRHDAHRGLLRRAAREVLALRQFLSLRILRLDARQRLCRRVFQLLIAP